MLSPLITRGAGAWRRVRSSPSRQRTPRRAKRTSDPAQADPAQADPAQADPAQAYPAQADPAQADPAQAEPVQTPPRSDQSRDPSGIVGSIPGSIRAIAGAACSPPAARAPRTGATTSARPWPTTNPAGHMLAFIRSENFTGAFC